jgi:hypothetical protein
MTQIAILEQLDGKSTDWMEKVSDNNTTRQSRHNDRHPLHLHTLAPMLERNRRRPKIRS